MQIRLQLFDSRIARRVFGLLFVASLVPLFMLALWLSQRVGGEIEQHAKEQLAAAARSYGRLTLEKLFAVSAVLPSAESQRSSSPELAAAAVVRHGTADTLFGEWPIPPASIPVVPDEPTIALVRGAEGYDVIVARGTSDGARC